VELYRYSPTRLHGVVLNYFRAGRTFIGGLVGRWRDLSSPTNPVRAEIHYEWPALVHEVNTTYITGHTERNCLVLGLQFEF
jgi:hypothetical protein